jgi:hypothetical protein
LPIIGSNPVQLTGEVAEHTDKRSERLALAIVKSLRKIALERTESKPSLREGEEFAAGVAGVGVKELSSMAKTSEALLPPHSDLFPAYWQAGKAGLAGYSGHYPGSHDEEESSRYSMPFNGCFGRVTIFIL